MLHVLYSTSVFFFFFLSCEKSFICIAVPPTYPLDEELIKLCMVNQLLRLGLAEYFVQEIEEVLAQVYRYIYNRTHLVLFINSYN
jgi:hypothetical protein